ncbi:efflux RND transporter permease subunit [Pleionea sp. CnH1-48]|uniref:efflux RND transporter permease subunit n=1 Tax=Pleionea sp. CnH1-48 TaxID=2954494 RepID=UPI0020984BA9|nr:efflux RND transporter permease subunit [Pleionea sp. CnH1-48]MCO7226927.1 efflux RND transporter permease subunit [Pleionea sp. CnH1-48]
MQLSYSLIQLSTRRPVTISMFTIALLMFGMVLVNRLGLTLLPDLSYPTLTVRTEFTGAAPAEVENLITKPIEESLGVIKGLREIRSVSRAGQSDVMLEFEWGSDMGFAGLDVREKLDIVQLPLEVKRPSLLRFNPSLDPIIRLSLSNKEDNSAQEFALNDSNLIQLRRFSEEEIKRRIESIEGIAAVKISGGLEDEIQVLVDQNKLAQLNLSIDQVAARLKAENVNLSGGRLEEGTQQYLVRTINQYGSVEAMANSIIANVDGHPVYLRDVAEVFQRYKEREAITRINGIEAVEIAIYKEGDANTVTVAQRLKKRLKRVEKSLPDNYKLDKIYDQSHFIEQSINEVILNAIIGGVLAMIVLYLFLKNFRATLIISLSIPISVIVSFNMMYGFGITMNIMSLGGLALAVGLLVDNAIVVLENIARKREEGADIMEAAQQGAGEVASAIVAATLTTVAVFLPLVFVQGIAGQLFSDQALTVTFALIISLIVAVTLIPMLSSLGGRKNPYNATIQEEALPETRGGRIYHRVFVTAPTYVYLFFQLIAGLISTAFRWAFKPLVWGFNIFYKAIASAYKKLLDWSLKFKAIVILVAVGVFTFSLSLVPLIGVELIPQLSQGELAVEIKAVSGTPLKETDGIVTEAQNRLSNIDAIERTYSVAGSGNRLDASPDKGGENWGQLSVVLKKPVNHELEEQVIRQIRESLSTMAGIEVKVSRPTLFSFKTPLEVEIVGFNREKVKQISQALVEKMQNVDRFSDIKSTVEQGHPEVQIVFDHERAAHLGLSVPEVANNVVRKLRGEVATKYAFRDRKIDVLVRASETDRSSVEDVRRLIVNPQEDRPLTLSAIATVTVAEGPSEIHRTSQERVAIVSANLKYGDLGQGAAKLAELVDELPPMKGVEVRVTGQNEEMQVSFNSLKFALALAIFLVYLVMASQFESLLHPFVILFSVPLALVGAIFALYLTGSTISVVVFIGLIMLAGIVVNNAIVLIDRINQLRETGMAKLEAIKSAGQARLRPIVMTTLTTTLGMLPLALGIGEGAEIRAPMAITVIGGLLISTLLTLIVIPVLYSLFDRRA